MTVTHSLTVTVSVNKMIATCERFIILLLSTLLLYIDLAGVNNCMNVYPQVVNLLCKWHVDRYPLVKLQQSCMLSNNMYNKLQGMAEKAEFICERLSAEGGVVRLFGLFQLISVTPPWITEIFRGEGGAPKNQKLSKGRVAERPGDVVEGVGVQSNRNRHRKRFYVEFYFPY